MAVSIKSQKEIELMREAGRLLAITHEELAKFIKPGMSTYEIDFNRHFFSAYFSLVSKSSIY